MSEFATEPHLDAPPLNSQLRELTRLRIWNSNEQAVAAAPLTHGIDLPQGLITNASRLRVTDTNGRQLAIQSEPLAWWSDGSIKWLLVDILGRDLAAGWTELPVLLDDRDVPLPAPTVLSPDAEVSDPCSVEVTDHGVLVRRGSAASSLVFPLTTASGRRVLPRIIESVWETRGPVRWTLRIEGTFPQCRGLRFHARLHSFYPTGLLKLEVRLHNPRRARHKGGLWDLGDAGSIQFQAFDVDVSTTDTTSSRSLTWQAEPTESLQTTDGGTVCIYQDSSGRENWNSRNHVDAAGNVPCRFRGFRVRTNTRESTGRHAQPLFRSDEAGQLLSVCVPEFWQQFPKALEWSDGQIRIGLFPAEWNGLFELQGGEQKTHTVWLSLSERGDEAPGNADLDSLNWTSNPPQVVMTTEWHVRTQAIPYFTATSDEPHSHLTPYLDAAINGGDSLLARRDVVDEFGWRNFGEVWADHEQAYFDGDGPIVSHYNNQFDVIYGGLLNQARSENPDWRELFGPLARHVVDIDIYHTEADRAAYNGGLFWHTDHYVAAASATHRTYSAANQKAGCPYGGGPSDEHNYTSGLLHYYWMTGNRDAYDAVRSLADWVINVDDGSRTIFGLVDDGPTGRATATAFPDYHGPGRGAGNSVNALLDGWLLTGERKYLDYAETLIHRVIHPKDDIDALDLLNVEARWSYTVFLSALAKYLDIKAEAGERDDHFAYAAASLAHYGRWMAEHELPYFDQIEKLEFPTETWAAQELRKANVMRLAAKYCDEPDRTRLLQRGTEFADRAWLDLAGFETRFVARSLALVLTEGARDCWLRNQSFDQCCSVPPFEPSPKTHFVGQQDRVKQKLNSPAGLLSCVVAASNPRRWPRFVNALMRQL
ncbi:MAG: RIFT barrel domain-containing protein [Planctomycetota bacterium]|jgi:hypothetical protein